MALIKYEPKNVWDQFSDAWDLRNEMNRVMDAFIGRPTDTTPYGWHPAVDIYEEKDHYVVKAELPGMKADDIKVSVVNNTLTLKGERKEEKEGKYSGYYRLERTHGQFSRAFQLPTEVDAEKIKAEFKDGILNVEVPKSERAKPKEISIKVS